VKLLADPDETLDDVISLCAKVAHVHDTTGRVHMNDLVELRDTINDIRSHVAGGGGYKSLPRLVKPADEER
jgi:hypothetical protein